MIAAVILATLVALLFGLTPYPFPHGCQMAAVSSLLDDLECVDIVFGLFQSHAGHLAIDLDRLDLLALEHEPMHFLQATGRWRVDTHGQFRRRTSLLPALDVVFGLF